MSEIRAAIADLVEGRFLDPERLEAAFDEIMDGRSTPAGAAGLLVALRMKGETAAEIVAVARALRSRAAKVGSCDPRTLDTCGTGGSGLDTFNISTTAALVVAGAGVPVAKHGNRAVSSRSGSFDVLEALGVRIDLPLETCARILADVGIAPFFARTAHPAFRHLAPVRAELGVRTVLNCLGPLLSPVGARRQVVGVYSEALVEPLAEALLALGASRGLVVHGDDGLDELTTTASNSAAWLADGRIERLRIDPEALGLPRATLEDLSGGDPETNARIVREVLSGTPGPRRDIVLLNAAAALWVADVVSSLEEGLARAARSIDEGAAAKKLEALRAATVRAGERLAT
jgi:anthranilate phosphoribosyltransferase